MIIAKILLATQEFNKLIAENFAVRLKQANLARKYDMVDLAKNKF